MNYQRPSLSAEVNISFKAKPLVLRFIGDSHSLIFDNLLFEFTGLKQVRYLYVKTPLYMLACYAREFTDGASLAPAIVKWLLAERLLQRICVLRDRDLPAKRKGPVAITCGASDLFTEFLRDPRLTTEHLHKLSTRQAVCERFKPLHRSIDLLRCASLGPVFLLAIPPPISHASLDTKNPLSAPALARIAGARLFNEVNREMCSRSGAIFINLWEELGGDMGLSAAYNLDGCHLNGKAALLVLSAIAETLKGLVAP